MYLFDEVGLVQTQNLPASELWLFLPVGYLLTILIETPVLFIGLTPKLARRQRLLCGVWLTACTYPIVVLVLPLLFLGAPRWQYLAVAETFAPLAECLLFFLAFRDRSFHPGDWIRSFVAIIIANLLSFGAGELLHLTSWFGLF